MTNGATRRRPRPRSPAWSRVRLLRDGPPLPAGGPTGARASGPPTANPHGPPHRCGNPIRCTPGERSSKIHELGAADPVPPTRRCAGRPPEAGLRPARQTINSASWADPEAQGSSSAGRDPRDSLPSSVNVGICHPRSTISRHRRASRRRTVGQPGPALQWRGRSRPRGTPSTGVGVRHTAGRWNHPAPVQRHHGP